MEVKTVLGELNERPHPREGVLVGLKVNAFVFRQGRALIAEVSVIRHNKTKHDLPITGLIILQSLPFIFAPSWTLTAGPLMMFRIYREPLTKSRLISNYRHPECSKNVTVKVRNVQSTVGFVPKKNPGRNDWGSCSCNLRMCVSAW